MIESTHAVCTAKWHVRHRQAAKLKRVLINFGIHAGIAVFDFEYFAGWYGGLGAAGIVCATVQAILALTLWSCCWLVNKINSRHILFFVIGLL